MTLKMTVSAATLFVAAIGMPVQAATSISAGLPSGSYSASTSTSPGAAEAAFNGGTWQASLGAPQWLRVDLGTVQAVGSVTFRTQFGSPTEVGSALYGVFVTTFDDTTFSGSPYASAGSTWLSGTEVTLEFSAGLVAGRYVAIVIPDSNHIPSLSDVRVFAPVPEVGTAAMMLAGLTGVAALAG